MGVSLLLIAAALLWSTAAAAQTPATAPGANGFPWPEGARAAVSLTFDDARPSQTFVGRGLDTRSYVPLVAATFVAGRGWLGEAPNDPERCDLAQVLGMEMDGKDFEQVRPLLEQARQGRSWLVLAGHDIGEPGVQTTRVGLLEKLLPYLRDPANGFWTAPMGTVANAIRRVRARKE